MTYAALFLLGHPVEEGSTVVGELNRSDHSISSEAPRKKRFLSEKSVSMRMKNPTKLQSVT